MDKKIFIVIDFQNDFVNGALGFEDAEKLDDIIAAKIEEYRANGWEIAFTFDTHGEDYLETREGQKLPVAHCVKGTHGWQLFGKTAGCLRMQDKCFLKPTFGSLELGEYLRNGGYSGVELAGLVSNICVLSNAVIAKAALPEAEIYIDRRCTAGQDESMTQKAFDILAGIHIDIV